MADNVISIRMPDNSIVKLESHDHLENCAALAREYAQNGYPDRFALVTEVDYAHGAERGLYMSLILRPSMFPSQAGLLSALACVALTSALEEHTTKKLGIGWVSNVYCEGDFIGSVTIEGKLDNYTTYEYIIVNFAVQLSESNFPPRLSDLIKKVFESDNATIATIIAKNILSKFFPYYANMKNHLKYMNVYRHKFILSGMKIKHIVNGKRKTCKVLSVDVDNCTLMVEKSDKRIEFITSAASVIIPKKLKLPKK